MRELIRVNSIVEANDLTLFLNLNGVNCQVPDQYSLGIGGFSSLASAKGRILVEEGDYERAHELLKQWRSPLESRAPDRLSRVLENPLVIGMSWKQIVEGLRSWSSLSVSGKIRILGGLIVYGTIVMAIIGYLIIWLARSL